MAENCAKVAIVRKDYRQLTPHCFEFDGSRARREKGRVSMAELWELICHHTYRRHSRRRCRSIAAAPQVTDKLSVWMTATSSPTGVATGSGSVRFYKQDGRIRVPTEAIPWRSIVGVKGEVTLRRQPSIGFIIDSDAFQFHIRGNTLDMPGRLVQQLPKSIF